MQACKKSAQIGGSVMTVSHGRIKLTRHKWNCTACRYGDCKAYAALEADYFKAIAKHKELTKRLAA